MTRDKLIEEARHLHDQYADELRANPERPIMPRILLWDRKDNLDYFALALDDEAPNFKEFVRTLRLTIQAKIVLEGACASIHQRDMFVGRANTAAQQQEFFRRGLHKEPHGVERAYELGLFIKKEAIQTIAESAFLKMLITQEYRREGRGLEFEKKKEEIDLQLPRSPFIGFDWPTVQ